MNQTKSDAWLNFLDVLLFVWLYPGFAKNFWSKSSLCEKSSD